MLKILVVAPHPDDETLGCGGVIARHISEGHEIHWLIVTRMSVEKGFSKTRIEAREKEIEAVGKHYGFASIRRLAFDTTRLDTYPTGDIVGAIKEIVNQIEPEILYVPFRGDAHSDHKIVFDACSAASKWFRAPFLKTVLAYETLSETGFNMDPAIYFNPNWYENIEHHLNEKVVAMKIFDGELADPPFPRSVTCIEAQARIRGGESGYKFAEAFILLRHCGSYQNEDKN